MRDRKPYQKFTQESEVFLFGKHIHQTIQHVLRKDPAYILWLAENGIARFSDDILEDANDNVDDEYYSTWDLPDESD